LRATYDGKNYAIKAILDTEQILEKPRFYQEREILELLNHPKIPKFVEEFFQDNVYYIVQDYLSGFPLSTLLCRGWVFTEGEVKNLLRQLLSIIIYLHDSTPKKRSIIHRDLRLSNLLLQGKDLFLIDFGLACYKGEDSSFDQQSVHEVSSSNLHYSAYRLLRKADCPESDLFGIGIVGLDLLSSQVTDETLFEQPWQSVLRVSYSFQRFLEKTLSQNDNYGSAKEAFLDICLLE